VLITGGTIYEGGRKRYTGDVAIPGDKITYTSQGAHARKG